MRLTSGGLTISLRGISRIYLKLIKENWRMYPVEAADFRRINDQFERNPIEYTSNSSRKIRECSWLKRTSGGLPIS